MKTSPETTVHNWLSKSGIRVSPNLLKRQLKSHPDYPSLLSITDTLEYFGIENAAVQIEKELIYEVSTPFLAHLRVGGGEFVMVQNRDTVEKTYPGFYENWSGVVIAAEKKPLWHHPENEAWINKEKQQAIQQSWAIFSAILLAAVAVFEVAQWTVAALILIAFAGIAISWLIISKDLGFENKVADRFCGNTDHCNSVIKSKTLKLPFGAGWGDVGIIWFGSLLTMVVLAAFATNTSGIPGILSVLSVVAVCFIIFSVLYQWLVIKKWCRLCLTIAAILLLQFVALLSPLQNFTWQNVQVKDISFITTCLLLITIAWLTVKNLLLKYKKAEDESIEGLRFKKNPVVLATIFETQKTVDYVPRQKDLQLGNAKAALQITVACNPYCKPCAKAHEKLHNLLEQHGDKTGLTIRFTITELNSESKTIKTIRHLLQHIEAFTTNMDSADKAAYTRDVLHQWFKTMDYKIFAEKYPVTELIEVDDTLAGYQAWTAKCKINFTPTIFINGRQLPAQYNVDDLAWLMNTFEELFPVQETLISENEAALT